MGITVYGLLKRFIRHDLPHWRFLYDQKWSKTSRYSNCLVQFIVLGTVQKLLLGGSGYFCTKKSEWREKFCTKIRVGNISHNIRYQVIYTKVYKKLKTVI